MKCPECQTDNPEINKFCRECGSKLAHACPQCGAEVLLQDKFCGQCGHSMPVPSQALSKDLSFDEKLAKIQRYLPEGLTEKILSQRERIEGERKQVTVMFCDMEGFTQLTERLGSEEAYAVMDDVYEILIHKVHDYEGTVNEMTGDGIMAMFGAPITLEDAPQRALRSALAIHREMTRFNDSIRKDKTRIPPLKMRVGIHTGSVVVGTLGNDLRVDFKAVGDTVNLASRMEHLAQPGTTYVTEDVFRVSEGLFRFESLGTKQVKGKEGPVTVYQLIAPSTRRTRFDVSAERGLTPFVGRERELELLLDGFERAKAGRGQAFSIVAEAGIGKSRVLYEFRKAVANEDISFLEGKSLSYSRGIAYHPVIDMLKSNFDIQEGDGSAQIAKKAREGLKLIGTDESHILHDLLDLLSVEENGVERVALSPEARSSRIVEALKNIVVKGSEMRPLVMAFEDLHWVDRSSEDVLKMLLDSIPSARVFLIFTYRPEFVQTWGAKSFHSQLTLNRLSNRESTAMVTHLLGTEAIERKLEDLILEKTEGVPFFIEELVKSLRDLKLIERKGEECRLMETTREVAIPSTVQDVIMARVDSLPEGAKQLLQVGSVIDREFGHEVIKRATGLPEQEILSRLSSLKDSELLYERGIYPHVTYVFKHALTQEVAYNSLLLKMKRENHEKIGKALEELYPERREENYELLAYHYAKSENKPKAVQYLELANRKAAAANAMEEAKGYFDQAMAVLDELPETEEYLEQRISLLVKQRTVFAMLLKMRDYYDLLTHHQPLLAGTDSPGLLGAFYACLGYCDWYFGSYDQSIEDSKKGAKLCEAEGRIEHTGLAYYNLQWSHFQTGKYDQAIAFHEEVLRKVNEQTDLRDYVMTMASVSTVYSWHGRWKEGIEVGQRGLKIAEKHQDKGLISYAALSVSQVYTSKGDLDRGIEYAELAVRNAPTPADKVYAEATLGWVLCRIGDTSRAVEILAPLVATVRAAGYVTPEMLLGLFLAEAYCFAGDNDKTTETCERLLYLAERHGARPFAGRAHELLGQVSLETSIGEAAGHFEKAISISQEIKAENELALAYSGMGRYHKQQGNVEEARKYLTDALDIFERLGTLIEPDKVSKELAGLPAAG